MYLWLILKERYHTTVSTAKLHTFEISLIVGNPH